MNPSLRCALLPIGAPPLWRQQSCPSPRRHGVIFSPHPFEVRALLIKKFRTARPRRPAALKLPGPYTQRICVDRYWLVTSQSTERINHSAAIKFAFYAYIRHQSVIFSLHPASHSQKRVERSRDEIKRQAFQLAERWQALIGTNGIKTKADLARYIGVSRARVTQVLNRLVDHQLNTVETANLTTN